MLLSPRLSDLCNKVAECPTANSEQNFHKLGGDRTTSAPWGSEGRSFERLLATKVNLAGFLQRLRACFRVPHFQSFWSEAYTLGTISVGRCFLLGGILPSGLFIGVHLVERITKLPDNLSRYAIGVRAEEPPIPATLAVNYLWRGGSVFHLAEGAWVCVTGDDAPYANHNG